MTSPTIVVGVNSGPVQRTQGSLSGTYTAASDVNTTKNASLAAGVLTLTVGYEPRHVRFVNQTTRIQREWFYGMAANTTLDSDANGTMTLNTSSALVVTDRTGTGGSVSQAGGTAGGSSDCTVVITASGLFTDNDAVCWLIEG